MFAALTCYTVANARDEVQLTRALRSVLASKHYGHETFLSTLVSRACIAVMPPAPKRASVAVDNVRVCKLIGGSVADSTVIHGVVVMKDTEVHAQSLPS